MTTQPNEIARRLADEVEAAHARLKSISEQRASEKPSPEKWAFKEILGHLIDSASNNHQRIVRMQEIRDIGTFRYSQEHWVNAQKYRLEPWANLVELWYHYNNHLAHIISRVEPSALSNTCEVGDPRPVSLQHIIEDYLRHVQHHLDQIFDPQHHK